MQSQMKAGLLTLTLFTSAAWAEPPTIDISEFRQDLVVLKVGEANYLVTTIDNRMSQQTYWGTRKTLYELEGRSASSEGGPDNYTRASAYFVENTLEFTDQIYLEWKEGIWKLRCGNQELPLTPASEAEAHRLLETAEFRNYYWEREPVMLARDEYGTYYYVDRNVDRDLSAASSDKYHVYTGWMGNMV